MPAHRLPQAKAEVSGAVGKNAGRFAGRRQPARTRPLGEPYVRMTDAGKLAWAEIQVEVPWLRSHHRPLVRMAAELMGKMDEGTLTVNSYGELSRLLSKLGMTPVDETKVTHGDDGDEDPTDKLFSS